MRSATAADVPALEALIKRSAGSLSRGYYTREQTRAAIDHVFGVDTELVTDGTYLVAEDAEGRLLGCGGWSRRETLFGGDRFADRSSALLDPAVDAARIRAFFVAPEAARRGVASALLAACAHAAGEDGFGRLALMSTLPGVALYARHGFLAAEQVMLDVAGVEVAFVPMAKPL